ncbi:DUF4783 domain-containing protein [Mucilaginibacter sp.]|uniref:DUF4783 domain-containing protein n=1 Tax=Mucilaginibacter sp. TaxID=1882438 RepID=UPI00283C8109|nr:DUF4783 domain-containing protein [Mucilaginibacter sp.]MDR3693311.1 DUF4783 domain-containing protein [Mucilaginibacter sp.]
MKNYCLPLLIVLLMAPVRPPADPIDKIANLVRQRNIPELSKLFADNVELSILGDENVYSRLQTEQILTKFFSQNEPKTIKLLHKVNSNPKYGFGVLLMTANTGVYRIAVTLKETAGTLSIIEFRIETDKVK